MSRLNPVRVPPHIVAEVDEGGLGAVDAVSVSEKKSNLWLDAWRDLRRNWLFWVSMALILVIVFTALFPTVWTQVPPNDGCYLSKSNAPPEPGHPLGFTLQGCDILARIVHGTSTSLSVGLIVTVLVVTMGVVIGAFAGYFGGWLDSVLMRVGDIFFAIPYVLAAVVVMSIFLAHRNVFVISLAIGFFVWPATARILRAEVLRVKRMEYVLASEALGASRLKTMFTHVSTTTVLTFLTILRAPGGLFRKPLAAVMKKSRSTSA